MREILFRGKRMTDGKWVYGDYHKYTCTTSSITPTHTHYIMGTDIRFKAQICVDPDTVGQYTGLTDKNGVKIFEGDVVQALTPQKGGTEGFNIGTVEFHKSAFSVKWSNFLTYGRSFIGYLDNIEVIGNIHENHELLSKEKSQC